MESQPQNPELMINPETFTHAIVSQGGGQAIYFQASR